MLFQTALALVILTGNAKIDSPPCSLAALQSVAVSLELLDARESRWVFARESEFASDLRSLRERYDELRYAPFVCDAERFPGRELLTQLIDANRQCKTFLEDRQQIFRDEWIADALTDCNRLYAIYDLCRDAKCPYYYVTVRRKALMQLRDALGPQAYYGGFLPRHVPVWYFRRIGE